MKNLIVAIVTTILWVIDGCSAGMHRNRREILRQIWSEVFPVSHKGVIDRHYILRTPWFGIKAHYIHGSDDEWHTHPWNGFSFIFGEYDEWLEHAPVAVPGGDVRKHLPNLTLKHRRRWFNRIYAHKRHKVEIIKPVWTIFIHGPRRNESWQYGETVAPWRGPDFPNQSPRNQ